MSIYLKTGVFKTSLKENEKRLPIYPEHLKFLSSELLESMTFEEGYGLDFGVTDRMITELGSAILPREDLFKQCPLLILPKPTVDDMKQMIDYQILSGWAHAVQQFDITQIAIEKKLTLLAWEEMYNWETSERKGLHIFCRNNELAGYAGVIHYLGLKGMDGHYGPRRQVSVLGYGSVSRGAIYALQGRGYSNIHVYTMRPTHLVADKNPDVYYHQMFEENDKLFARTVEGKVYPLIDDLAKSDIIFNGVMQNVNKPLMFILNEEETKKLKPFTSIIDISCDRGMGFYFANPTTFEEPIFEVGDNISYYSIDHTPTHLWNAASREISLGLLPYLQTLMNGERDWACTLTIARATDIFKGIIRNQNIVNFQKREKTYPYKMTN